MPENNIPFDSFKCTGISLQGRRALNPEHAETVTVTKSEEGLPQLTCLYLENGACFADPEARLQTAPACYRFFPETIRDLTHKTNISSDDIPTHSAEPVEFGKDYALSRDEGLVEFGKLVDKALIAEKEHGRSLRDVAKAVGISPTYLSFIRDANNPTTKRPPVPNYEIAVKLCQELGLTNIEDMLHLIGYVTINRRTTPSS